MMRFNNVTIGADPELFLINKNTGTVVSAIGIIPGEKGEPYTDNTMSEEGFGVEIDNVLGEFNIPPCTMQAQFVRRIEFMKSWIRSYVQKINPDLDILCKASMIVPDDQLNNPIAQLFGCSVDYNAYTEDVNPKPEGDKTNLRSAGFHIHIGYKGKNTKQSILLVKYLDACLGLPSVILDPDTQRRSLYGKAGAFRLTPYGLEYRVLSSYMMSSPELLDTVWRGIKKAIHMCALEAPLPPADLVLEAINNSDVALANKLISEYQL